MCELFGVSAERKVQINTQLDTFFGHSIEHRNGWGLVLFDKNTSVIQKEPKRAIDSSCLKETLQGSIETAGCLAHIRKATIGDITYENTHPFAKEDESGRRWILVHNGTIFDAPVLSPYQYLQKGSTDSERILWYLVDEIDKAYRKKKKQLSPKERIRVIETAIHTIVPGNKVNLMLYDGALFYLHKNEQGTMYRKNVPGGAMFATHPLDAGTWIEVPENRLLVYQNGQLLYTGQRHSFTYVHDEEHMKLLYLAYSAL